MLIQLLDIGYDTSGNPKFVMIPNKEISNIRGKTILTNLAMQQMPDLFQCCCFAVCDVADFRIEAEVHPHQANPPPPSDS
jgi:hypothetical protein